MESVLITGVSYAGATAGYVIGAINAFSTSLYTAVLTGNYSEVARLLAVAAAVWLGFGVIKWALSYVLGLLKLIAKLIILASSFYAAVYVYHNGFESAWEKFQQLVNDLASELKLTSHSYTYFNDGFSGFKAAKAGFLDQFHNH